MTRGVLGVGRQAGRQLVETVNNADGEIFYRFEENVDVGRLKQRLRLTLLLGLRSPNDPSHCPQPSIQSHETLHKFFTHKHRQFKTIIQHVRLSDILHLFEVFLFSSVY